MKDRQHPPLNIFGPDTIPLLNEIVTALETAARRRIGTLLERGLNTPGDVENRLGHHVGQL